MFLTDNELGFSHPGALREEDYVEAARGADLLLHDAQYSDEEYAARTRGWGHSTYTRAADFAARAAVKRFGTFHHDPDHDDRQIDASMQALPEGAPRAPLERELLRLGRGHDRADQAVGDARLCASECETKASSEVIAARMSS